MTEWICTDPDCCQYCKKIDDWTYSLVEIRDYGDSAYVCRDIIDLQTYTIDEMREYVKSYYASMETIVACYGFKKAFQIIAECIFESLNINEVSCIKQDSYEAAKDYIKALTEQS